MTALLYVKDYMKEKLGADELQLNFDKEGNLTNEEEILEQTVIDQVYVKIVQSEKAGHKKKVLAQELFGGIGGGQSSPKFGSGATSATETTTETKVRTSSSTSGDAKDLLDNLEIDVAAKKEIEEAKLQTDVLAPTI